MNMFGVYWWLLAICGTVVAFSEKEISKRLFVEHGERASFDCKLDVHYIPSNCTWTKRNMDGSKTILTINERVVSLQNRITVTIPSRIFGFYGYPLDIINVNQNDSGIYECRLDLNNGTVTIMKYLLVVLPRNNDIPRVSVTRGDAATLRYFNDVYRLFDVAWTKVGSSLPVGSYVRNGVLTIPSTTLNDSGSYLCSLFGTYLIRQTIELEVVPELDVIIPNPCLFRPTGYSVNLTCVIFSPSPVKVTWMKSGRTVASIPKHQSYLLQDDGSSPYTMKSVRVAQLHIESIKADDFDTYVCRVENEFATLKGVLQLSFFRICPPIH